jgi:hypothetical protein
VTASNAAADPWTRLAEPLSAAASDESDTARFGATDVAAIRARLDAVVGVGGWSVGWVALPGEAIACHLVVGSVTKGGVVDAPAGFGARAAEIAFVQAAAAFGIVVAASDAPIASDAAREADVPPANDDDAAFGGADSAAEQGRAVIPAPVADSGALESGALESGALEPGVLAEPGVAPGGATEKPEAQQLIDRLLERLKSQGQGLVAARILVRYGGYGRDPVAARQLYAELRALLRSNRSSDTPSD